MTKIAVVANRKKTLGGGLGELRRILSESGCDNPLWFEASGSHAITGLARKAVAQGAELIFVWGGDGAVQRCIEGIAGKQVRLAILPAGTANLLAMNLQIPVTLNEAVDVGLHGQLRRLDVGVMNSERFAVMAGVGFDAVAMHKASKKLKEHIGRLAYVWTAARASTTDTRRVRVKVDGKTWFKGDASCVLFGQVSTLPGGLVLFPDARVDDGLLEIGVVTAATPLQWAGVFARAVTGHAADSVFTHMTRGRSIVVKLDRATRYEVDGGARKKTKVLRVHLEPLALTVCVPRSLDP